MATEFEKATYNGVITALQLLNEPASPHPSSFIQLFLLACDIPQAGFYSPDVVSVYKNAAYDAYGIVQYVAYQIPVTPSL